jgi:hypothetical protein
MSELIPFIPDPLTLASVTGLGAILGKIWANRVSSKEDSKIQTELASLRTDLERSLHVHRIQFEKEFQIYLELSDKMVSLRQTLFTLNKVVRSIFGDKKEHDLYYIPLRQKLKDTFSAFRTTALINEPFYVEEVFIAADQIIDLAADEIATQDSYNTGESSSHERIMEMRDKITNSTEVLVKAIRERIRLLKVVD